MTDYQEQIDNLDASYDEIDAERLRAEAAASQQAAQSQLDAAGTDAQRGHPEDIPRHELGAMTDTLEGLDASDRAEKLDVAAGLHAASTETFHERDDASAAAGRSDVAAQGAGMVLEFTDMSESDKTKWLAEKGAREGEAEALHKRSDDLTEQAIRERHQASKLEDEARDGLPGHEWEQDKHRGHPSSGGPGAGGAVSGEAPKPE